MEKKFIEKKNENLYWINELEEEIEEEEDEEFFDFYKILEKTLLKLSLRARAEISPLSSFMGGISAQENVKFIRKFRPINQSICFDFSEAVENLFDLKENYKMKDKMTKLQYLEIKFKKNYKKQIYLLLEQVLWDVNL